MCPKTSKLTVYDLTTYFSKQPGDIRCCPACGSSLTRSDIPPSQRVAQDLSDSGLIPIPGFSHLYECSACQWWAVRESWTLCEIYGEYDFLVVGETGPTGAVIEGADRRVLPWRQVLKNEHVYDSAMPLPDTLGELFTGRKRK